MQAMKEMFCTGTRENSCACIDCTQIDRGIHPDFTALKLEEGSQSIGIKPVRALVSAVETFPTMAPYRVVLIEHADRLTMEAANATLKMLEEPPRTSRFFLLAESQARVIPTIRSRCGLVSFNALSPSLVQSVLQRSAPDDAKALVCARLSEGSVGRALSYWGSGRLALRDKTFSLIRLALERDIAALFIAIDSVSKELPQVLRFLALLMHDILMASVDPTRILNLDLSDDIAQVSVRVGAPMWHRVADDVRVLRESARTTPINLAFHLKSLFAQSFAV